MSKSEFLGHGLNLPGSSIPIGGGSNTDVRTYSESFMLTNQIPIIGFGLNLESLIIAANPKVIIEVGYQFLLQFDGESPINEIYQVKEIERTARQLILKIDSKFETQTLSGNNATILLKKTQLINHQLNSENIICSLIHESGMIANHMSSAIIENNNQIKITPELPVAGIFTITIIAKKQTL